MYYNLLPSKIIIRLPWLPTPLAAEILWQKSHCTPLEASSLMFSPVAEACPVVKPTGA